MLSLKWCDIFLLSYSNKNFISLGKQHKEKNRQGQQTEWGKGEILLDKGCLTYTDAEYEVTTG